MSRRTPLPGADELFRSTGTPATTEATSSAAPPEVSPAPTTAAPVLTTAADGDDGDLRDVRDLRELDDLGTASRSIRTAPRRRARPVADRRPSGRERHDEKITVYVSADELLDLEHARLALRGDHGMPVDRGRVVREALAVVLADFEAKGEASILVRRLRGR